MLLCVVGVQDASSSLSSSLSLSSIPAYAQEQQQQQTEPYNQPRPCHINIQFNQYPVYHNQNKRLNPDNTAYPGDAIHYIFSFRGSDTCSNFAPKPIQSQGTIDMISHNVSKVTLHPHQDFEMVPKNMITTHYYKILDMDTRCKVHAGGTRTCITNYTLSDDPIYSIREDSELTERQWKTISAIPSGGTKRILRDDIKLEYTHAWNFTKVQVNNHIHSMYNHTAKEDRDSIDSFDNIVDNVCTSTRLKNSGCVYGHAEIDTTSPLTKCLIAELDKNQIEHDLEKEDEYCIDVPHQISLTVQGYGTERQKAKNGDTIYVPVLVQKTAHATIDVLDPTPNAVFEHPPIKDSDGYDSKNKDGTYYVWDLPAIQTMPELKFRGVRNDTISFEITRLNTPISNVFTDSCKKERCIITAHGDAITNTTINAVNGDRLDVDTAPTLDYLGWQNFAYRIVTYNIDTAISNITASTTLFIADYSPVYDEDVLAYTILDTEGDTTFEKQTGLAVYYLGSAGTGKDDDGGEDIIHKQRRSKINDSLHVIYANNPFEAYMLNSTLVLQGGKDITELTSSVYDSVLSMSGKDTLNHYNKTLISINNTASFTEEGFGRLNFMHDVIDEVSQFGISNITAYSTVLSSDFGGYHKRYLTSFVYDYPVSYVSSVLNVTAINADGSVDGATQINAQLRAVTSDTNKTMHLPLYMASHIRNAGYPEEYVDMYLGDMYDISNTADGSGMAIATINMPAVRIIPDVWEILNITGYDDESFTSLDERLVLSSPVTYQLDVSTGRATDTVNYYTYGFDSPMTYTVNADDANVLEHVRYLSTVHVVPPKNFGEIKYLTINGLEYSGPCRHGCLLSVDEDAIIVAENIWGGKATLHIVQQTWNGTASQYDIVTAYIDGVAPYLIVILLVFTAVFMYGRLYKFV